jgi:hypothetical protein
MVSRLHSSDTLSYGFDDTSSLVPENDGKCTLGVFAG